MAGNVDNRVVSMKFDNKSFQKDTADTMKSLDKLKESLKFQGASQGLDEISRSAGRFNLSGMTSAIKGVDVAFAALATVGITALANITSKAVDAGLKMAKALTLDNIIDGFKEYETNINSIQTILANTESKGGTLEGVNAALDELNLYADKTIYNFSEMTRNIGTFTAAGVGLDDSVRSIKGIANIAAVSGSNSQQASTAMYQLSQAIAAGSVKLQDWNSVVNAGMGGEVFQQSLFETGKALGTLTDVPVGQSFEEWKAAGNTFRESLQDGWITTEVLTTTLGGFTGELTDAELAAKGFSTEQIAGIQAMAKTATAAATEVKTATQLISVIQEAIGSGWASTFRIVIGDFEQAKSFFTGLSEAITGPLGRMAEARNEMLSGWSALGGRQALIEAFINTVRGIIDVVTPIKEAFREFFPKKTTADLLNASAGIRDFSEKLKIGAETANRIKTAFTIFFGAIASGIEIVKGIGRVFFSLISVVGKVAATLAGVFLDFGGDGAAAITGFLAKGQDLESFFDKLVSIIDSAGTAVVGGISKMGAAFDKVKDFFEPLVEKALEFKDTIFGLFEGGGGDSGGGAGFFAQALDTVSAALDRASDAGASVSGVFQAIGGFFQSIGQVILDAGSAVKGFFQSFVDTVTSVFSKDAFKPAVAGIGVGFLGGITGLLAYFAKNGLKFDFGQLDLFESITEAFDGLTDTLSAMQQNIKADTLKKIAIAVGILAVSIIALSFIDGQALAKSLAAIGTGLAALLTGLAALSKIDATGAKMSGLAVSMALLSIALLLFAAAIKVYSSFDTEEMIRGTIGIAGAIVVMILASKGLEKANGSIIRAAFGLTVLSIGLAVFAGAIYAMAQLSWAELFKGLVGIAIGLALFIAVSNTIDEKATIKSAGGLLLFGIALRGLASVLGTFAGMSWNDMIKGFVGITATLLIIIGAVALLPKNEDLILVATGLLLLSVALTIMANAVGTLGNMSIASLVTGLIAVAALIAILVIAANAMQGSIAGAAAMIVMAGALWVMAEVLEKIGNLGIGTILLGLLGIAAVLAVLGLAAFLLQPLLPALIGLGIALVAVGAGFALFGIGAKFVAEALDKLGTVGKESIDKLIEIIGRMLEALPEWATRFAEGVFAFVDTLLEMGPQLIDGMGDILSSILNLITEKTPEIAEMFGVLITAAIDLMREKIPEFIDFAYEMMIALGEAIRDNIGTLVTIAGEIVVEFLNAMAGNVTEIGAAMGRLIQALAKALGDHIQVVIDAGVYVFGKFLEGLGEAAKDISEDIGTLISDIAEAIMSLYQDFIDAGVFMFEKFLEGMGNAALDISEDISTLIKAITKAITDLYNDFVNAGIFMIGQFFDGLIKGVTFLGEKAKELAKALGEEIIGVTNVWIDTGIAVIKNIISGMVDRTIDFAFYMGKVVLTLLYGIRQAIRTYAEPIADAGRGIAWELIRGLAAGLGFNRAIQWIRTAVQNLANRLPGWMKQILGIKSPSKVFMKIGEEIPAGLALALNRDKTAQESAGDLATRVKNTFAKGMKDAAENSIKLKDLNPTIRPVLDLDQVKEEAKTLARLLDQQPIEAQLSLANANVISAATLTASEVDNTAGSSGGETILNFEQNNYSPKELSTVDIYRQTRGQITLAKEELKIP